MDRENFFVVHRDLPREGPGTPQEVGWAVRLAGLPEAAVICDACCGPGGDIADLLSAAPTATVLGVEKHAGFVEAAQARYADMPRVQVEEGDVSVLDRHATAPFDMIWCAGALYLFGLQDGLALMRRALKPGGVLAFSEPCFFTDTPSEAARAFWDGYDTRQDAEIRAAVADAGFRLLGQRKVADAGWEAYYQPMEARIAALRPGADAALSATLDECAKEAQDWRALREETGYSLYVARA